MINTKELNSLFFVGLLFLVFLGYVYFSSENRQKEIENMFFNYQNKEEYIDKCGEFFDKQKELTGKDDRINELCVDFAKVLNRLNSDLYYDVDYSEERPTSTPSPRGRSYE